MGYKSKQLAILYTDLFLQFNDVPKESLQLLAIASILVAIKVLRFPLSQTEESFYYSVQSAVAHTCNQYTTIEIEEMELKILSLLRWRVNLPVAGDFASTYLLFIEGSTDEETLARVNCVIDYYISGKNKF